MADRCCNGRPSDADSPLSVTSHLPLSFCRQGVAWPIPSHPCNCFLSSCQPAHVCVCEWARVLVWWHSLVVEECQKCTSLLFLAATTTHALFLSLSFSLRWTAIVLQRSPLELCAKCQVQMAKFFKWNDAGCRELETGVCRRKCNWNCCPTSAALYDLWICCQFAIVALTV